MKICDSLEKKNPKLIPGHLYQHEDGEIYICSYEERLVRLDNGYGYAANCGFDGDDHEFTDVTDQYCLKKISD